MEAGGGVLPEATAPQAAGFCRSLVWDGALHGAQSCLLIVDPRDPPQAP